MKHITPFIQALSQHFGQVIHATDESQTYTFTIDGEEIFLRYLPEDEAWVYFGFVTDFMAEVTQQQLEKALELNLFGRGTADFHLGLMSKALVLSGKLPIINGTPEALIEALIQLSQHLTPLHQTLTSTQTEDFIHRPEQSLDSAESSTLVNDETITPEIPNNWNTSFIQV